jgi:cell wall-associated NlpC family hydrolase
VKIPNSDNGPHIDDPLKSPGRRGSFSFMGPFVTRRIIERKILAASVILLALTIAGCSSSSRFGGKETKKETSEGERKHTGPRFGSKEKEEETKENDKKVEPKEVERIAKGERDFKREKNAAIKPLDQSKMMKEISRYMGVPYVYGGMTEDGLDCSGYTSLVYNHSVGMHLPRSSSEQSKVGKSVAFADLKFGDLIFFNTTGESASHVGIYLGDDLFAHASVSLGVTISSLESSYYKTRFELARRIVD